MLEATQPCNREQGSSKALEGCPPATFSVHSKSCNASYHQTETHLWHL